MANRSARSRKPAASPAPSAANDAVKQRADELDAARTAFAAAGDAVTRAEEALKAAPEGTDLDALRLAVDAARSNALVAQEALNALMQAPIRLPAFAPSIDEIDAALDTNLFGQVRDLVAADRLDEARELLVDGLAESRAWHDAVGAAIGRMEAELAVIGAPVPEGMIRVTVKVPVGGRFRAGCFFFAEPTSVDLTPEQLSAVEADPLLSIVATVAPAEAEPAT